MFSDQFTLCRCTGECNQCYINDLAEQHNPFLYYAGMVNNFRITWESWFLRGFPVMLQQLVSVMDGVLCAVLNLFFSVGNPVVMILKYYIWFYGIVYFYFFLFQELPWYVWNTNLFRTQLYLFRRPVKIVFDTIDLFRVSAESDRYHYRRHFTVTSWFRFSIRFLTVYYRYRLLNGYPSEIILMGLRECIREVSGSVRKR